MAEEKTSVQEEKWDVVIKQLHWRFLYKGPGHSHLLTLTARKHTAIFIKFFCHHGIDTLIQFKDPV